MAYKIVLNAYVGPLDLLLSLIEKAEIDIYDIPINLITEQFIDHVYKMEENDLDLASEFLLMVATLLEIKSKMLLPYEKSEEDEEDGEDPRDELVRQLLEYKKYKEAAENLKEFEMVESKAYYKPQEDLSYLNDEEIEIGLFDLDLLVKSISKIIARRGLKEEILNVEEIQREEFTLDDCIDNIMFQLKFKEKFKFSMLIKEDSSINEIITYFLSVLELARLGTIYIKQDDNFSDILIKKGQNEVGL